MKDEAAFAKATRLRETLRRGRRRARGYSESVRERAAWAGRMIQVTAKPIGSGATNL